MPYLVIYCPADCKDGPNPGNYWQAIWRLTQTEFWGCPYRFASTVVMAFILFGVLLGLSGGSRFFTGAATLGMGRFRGGSMKIAVLASGLFGSISGSAVANGWHWRCHHPDDQAGRLSTAPGRNDRSGCLNRRPADAASDGGFQPSDGRIHGDTYSNIVLAALVPALLYYLALFMQADLEAARLGIKAIPKKDMPAPRKVLLGVHFKYRPLQC